VPPYGKQFAIARLASLGEKQEGRVSDDSLLGPVGGSFSAAHFPGHGFGIIPVPGSFASSAFLVPPNKSSERAPQDFSATPRSFSACCRRRRSCPGGERGDRQSSVPADSTPSRASPTGRRIGGYDYKTEAIRRPRADNHTRSREMTKAIFRVFGKGVREITSREETERPPEESARQIPARSRLAQEPKARWRSGSATAPEQVWQAPGLREFRLAESQQILPLTGNRKPTSNRTHWLQPVPCSSRRRLCPGGERGDRQSSVPADSTPSRASPTDRRIAGCDYKTDAIQVPRAAITHTSGK